MDELIDIVDAKGFSTGKTILKSIAHLQGIPHASIHVWLYTKNGEILFQQRHPNKDTFANYWDVSVVGHISAGESPIDTCVRETAEEINYTIDISQLDFVSIIANKVQHHQSFIDYEFHHIYIAPLTVPISNLILQQTEVQNIQLITLDNFIPFSKNNNTVPRPHHYYHLIAKKIEEKIQ